MSTSQPGWGFGAGQGAWRDRQGRILDSRHAGKVRPLLQEAFPDEPAQAPVHLSSSLLNAPPCLGSLGQGLLPGEAGQLGLLSLDCPFEKACPEATGGRPCSVASSGDGMA